MLRREVLTTIGAILTPATAAERITTDLYTAGDGGYHSYRIPSLLATRKRTLLAFCEGRKHGAGDSGDIDLLVTDVMMPETSGPEAARAILALRPHLKVLFVSGYSAEQLPAVGEGTHFLSKPFSREELAQKIREVLASPS